MEESSCTLVIELFATLATCVDPLAWWWIHENQFPNVGFLAKQILKILGSQTI
jgi:hypothetical protein